MLPSEYIPASISFMVMLKACEEATQIIPMEWDEIGKLLDVARKNKLFTDVARLFEGFDVANLTWRVLGATRCRMMCHLAISLGKMPCPLCWKCLAATLHAIAVPEDHLGTIQS